MATSTFPHDFAGRLTGLEHTRHDTPDPIPLRTISWPHDAAGRVNSHDSNLAIEDVTAFGYDATAASCRPFPPGPY